MYNIFTDDAGNSGLKPGQKKKKTHKHFVNLMQ